MTRTTICLGLLRLGSAILALAPGACDDRSTGSSSTEQSALSIASVSAEWSAGECFGYCRRQTRVNADLTGSVVERPHFPDPAYPEKETALMLTSAEWEHVRALAKSAVALAPWRESYGCPDCSDGGAWKIVVTPETGAPFTTVLDNQRRAENPPALEALLEAIETLMPLR